ncbi:hypothetical protein LGV61_04185 [Desulfurispirillum indicum]|uniref:STAS domain-containing protein n=1 Tax=Desulfurispirillum indicum (strain ATCC BAA-1389 / DSM 22839 / S5) TaxID=653733 RepID=E6W317_DESIS|nr:hypothetical protein [Desulfurispirillum indicum]ADU65678.1 hypothetical protein Selin_0940 [Desulfurispirillum indicum S5]UCZ57483.1 hypothetical protein LGV61_04185 [Desulfurispirillum indicum]
MRIDVNGNQITIYGNIKTISDHESIKTTLDEVVKAQKEIVIILPESSTIISSVIGYFIKLIFMKKVQINVKVGNDNLYQMLQELELLKVLNVSKFEPQQS